MSELNGRQPDAPVPGEPEHGRPVTFTWQRPGGAGDARGPAAGRPPVGPPTGGGTRVSAEPYTGAAVGPDGASRGVPPAPAPAAVDPGSSGSPYEPAPTPPDPRAGQGPAEPVTGDEEVRRDRSEAFAVPPPGGRLSSGRGAHLAVRVTIALTCCLLLLGLTFIVGLLAGRAGTEKDNGVSAGDLRNFHVDTFPAQAAAAVAKRYSRLCLNATPADDPDQRAAQLRSIVTSNVPDDCGWDGRGKLSATDIEWTGQIDPMAQYGAHGRYLHMQAVLGTRQTPIQFVVPVYVGNLTAETGVRVAGMPGILPASAQPSGADAVTEADGATDNGLAQSLPGALLDGFFTAWGKSSATDLDRYRTQDASANVRKGLSGLLSDPTIEQTNVPLRGSGLGGSHTWQNGDAATVETAVRWKVPGGAHLTVAYRLTIVRNQSSGADWSVRDVAGGMPDSDLDDNAGGVTPGGVTTDNSADDLDRLGSQRGIEPSSFRRIPSLSASSDSSGSHSTDDSS